MSSPLRQMTPAAPSPHRPTPDHEPPAAAALAVPGRPARNTPALRHVRAQQRAMARQDAARGHLAPFLASAQPCAPTSYRFADLPSDAYGQGARGAFPDAPWRPAPWLAQELAAAEAA